MMHFTSEYRGLRTHYLNAFTIKEHYEVRTARVFYLCFFLMIFLLCFSFVWNIVVIIVVFLQHRYRILCVCRKGVGSPVMYMVSIFQKCNEDWLSWKKINYPSIYCCQYSSDVDH